MTVRVDEILFIGIGKTPVCWYRCALPAMHLGADWVGIHMTDDERMPLLHIVTGLVRNSTIKPNIDDYKVVIVQQPYGKRWFKAINDLRDRGIIVLYEVDDYLHGVHKQGGHDFSKHYDKKVLPSYELCMRAANGMICSTRYIATRYSKFNKNMYVCRNGIDMARYRLTKPERPTVNIGWAGATGHLPALMEWINGGMLDVMIGRDNTTFISIGQPQVARAVAQLLGESRALGIPFTLIESYPAAMTMLDIALAPTQTTSWYRGKSDLRWLEAGALGIPLIAAPNIYPEIEHGVTGFHASTPLEMAEILMELVDDQELRERVGNQAREHMAAHRDMPIAAAQWMEAVEELAGG